MLKVANSVISASRITGVLPVVNGGTGVTTSTGTGSVVLSNSPTFTNLSASGTVDSTGNAAFAGGAVPVAAGFQYGIGVGPNGLIGTRSATNDYRLLIGTNSQLDGTYRSTSTQPTSLLTMDAGTTTLKVIPAGTANNAYGAATSTITFDSSGIVTMSAYGAGTATFSAAGVISSVSDETWKIKDGVPIDPDAMLKKLEPGYWFYNTEKAPSYGEERQLGFYAQNVNVAIGPEAAPEPEEGKPWGYYDRSVLAITVMSLKKALATIESLTVRITALEKKCL